MKKKTFLFILPCLHLLIFTLGIKAQKVLVNLYQPPPNLWHVEDMWNLTLKNLTPDEKLTVYLHGKVTEANDGLIFEGTSAIFDIAPGFFGRIVRTDVEPADAAYANSEYEEMVLRTGVLPEGIYKICITVIDSKSLEVLGENCIDQIIAHSSPPELLTPLNESEVKEPMPVFLWLPPSPLRMGEFVTYTIKIVELLDGQVPIEAMEANPAFYTEQGISSTSFQLPISAKGFVPDNNYAWQVTADRENYEIGKSQVWNFTYLTKDTVPAFNCETTFCKPENWVFGTSSLNTSPLPPDTVKGNNTLFLSQPLKIPAFKIVSLKADLIAFQWMASDSCRQCNKHSRDWGNFVSGIVTCPGFTQEGFAPADPNGNTLRDSHELSWITETTGDSVAFNGKITTGISLPLETRKVTCSDEFRFAIRYTLAVMDDGTIRSCSAVQSYSFRRQHAVTMNVIEEPEKPVSK